MLSVIRLPICNAFLLRGKGAILVDSGRPKDAGAIENALLDQGVRLSDLSLLLHTHAHWDHCGSTHELRALSSAPVAVHVGDADRMRQGVNGPLKPTNLTAWLLHWCLNGRYPALEPDLVFEEEISLTPFGVDARILHTPGHTPGSISVLTEAGEAIVGDLIMGGWMGGRLFPRRPGLHYFAENVPQLYASLRRVLADAPQVIYPGHGGPLETAAVECWLARRI